MSYSVLIIGSGAREHAIAWKLGQSHHVSHIWVAPGNPGTAAEPKTHNLSIPVTNVPGLLQFAQEKAIDLTIIGSELPLSLGIVDAFTEKGLLCVGPKKQAAQLETSKGFAKSFMQRHQIPTAQYAEFTDPQAAKDYAKNHPFPQVIKADGLAAGKGVIIAYNSQEAIAAIEQLFPISEKLIIEEFLEGFEISFIVLTDGQTILPLVTTQDNKRRNKGNTGPNTGGMGAISPAPFINDTLEKKILDTIIQPTIKNMAKEGCPYHGFLFAGLMITPTNEAKVLEFNCRLGDPETQAIMMRLTSDLFSLCFDAARNQLNKQAKNITWDHRPSLSLVLATSQYPEHSVKNEIIQGLPSSTPENVHIFHAGTAMQNNQLSANGGRILTIGVVDNTLSAARETAHHIADNIHWPSGVHYRDDIGKPI